MCVAGVASIEGLRRVRAVNAVSRRRSSSACGGLARRTDKKGVGVGGKAWVDNDNRIKCCSGSRAISCLALSLFFFPSPSSISCWILV